MTQNVLLLLRNIVLDVDVPQRLREQALDALLMDSPDPNAAANEATRIASTVTIGHGAQLDGLTLLYAIKKLRELQPSIGLKEAKDRVEALEKCGRIRLSRNY